MGGKDDRADRFGAESQFQTDLQRFHHRRQKWGPSMAEQIDSGQKVNFRQNRNKNRLTERTQNESPKKQTEKGIILNFLVLVSSVIERTISICFVARDWVTRLMFTR